jgi:hypothetical protein
MHGVALLHAAVWIRSSTLNNGVAWAQGSTLTVLLTHDASVAPKWSLRAVNSSRCTGGWTRQEWGASAVMQELLLPAVIYPDGESCCTGHDKGCRLAHATCCCWISC